MATGSMQPVKWNRNQRKTKRKSVEASGWKPVSDLIRIVYRKKQEAAKSILGSHDNEVLYS